MVRGVRSILDIGGLCISKDKRNNEGIIKDGVKCLAQEGTTLPAIG